MVTWGFAVYKVGVMGIWFSVPGAMWKARCLMIGMSRWWTIATWNKESEIIIIIKKVKVCQGGGQLWPGILIKVKVFLFFY